MSEANDKIVRLVERTIQTPARQFLFFFILELVSFFICVANTRAFTQGSYFWTAVTDIFFGMQTFTVAKFTIDSPYCRTWWAGLGEIFGGTIGSLIAIWVTKHLYGG
jgi:hypothetical protein